MQQSIQTYDGSLKFWFGWLARLLLMVLLGVMLASLASAAIVMTTGIDIERTNFSDLSADEKTYLAWIYRLILFIQHLCMFIIPGTILLWLFYRTYGESLAGDLRWQRINPTAAWVGIFILLAAYPIVQFLAVVNKAIELPEILHQMEDQSAQLIKLLLTDRSGIALVANLLIMAITPAIGEELVFRGAIQPILGKVFRHPLVSVWLTAFLFSAMHFQFEGFLPRMALGLVLGYLMLWSGNILYPIIAHFFNNAMQILIQHFVIKDIQEIDKLDNFEVPFWMTIGAVVMLMIASEWYKSLLKNKAEVV